MRNIPPLAAVRVFEAAARHENFTTAAAELGMTQAAVSYQVRVLEERTGQPLFRREKKRVLLTDSGRRVAADLTRAFDAIDESFAQLRRDDAATLTVSTTRTFANAWLAWRLGGYQMANPDMAVRMTAEDALTDFVRDPADIAIRSGLGPWPGVHADLLFRIGFTPMCSPRFLAARGGKLTPADLLELPLIGSDDPWWMHWLREAGIEVDEVPGHGGIRLDSQASEGHAAMAGQGVAMLTPFFWRNDISDGRLVQPFAQVSTRGYGYWLVVPEHRRNVAKIRRFRDWLLSEIAHDHAAGAVI
jgi:LysR family transcriptional regulator, glycine cleavage system transcriptional activator